MAIIAENTKTILLSIAFLLLISTRSLGVSVFGAPNVTLLTSLISFILLSYLLLRPKISHKWKPLILCLIIFILSIAISGPLASFYGFPFSFLEYTKSFSIALVSILASFTIVGLTLLQKERLYRLIIYSMIVLLVYAYYRYIGIIIDFLQPKNIEIFSRYSGINIPIMVGWFSEPSTFGISVALLVISLGIITKQSTHLILKFASIAAIILSGSISGLLLLFVGVVFIYFKPNKKSMLILFGIISVIFITCFQNSFLLDRFFNVITLEDGSAYKRLIVSWAGSKQLIVSNYGFIGVGIGQHNNYVMQVWPRHPKNGRTWNTYAYMFKACGWFGLLASLLFVVLISFYEWRLGILVFLLGFGTGSALTTYYWSWISLLWSVAIYYKCQNSKYFT